MVLQQLPAPTVVWGFAPPGVKVSVQRLPGARHTAGASASNTTAADGVWWVTMPGLPAGNKSFKFKASTGGDSLLAAEIEMDDVVYGDVWVCSGQSNMAVVVAQVRCV
jgi:sialate O-acetylesterase